MKVTCIHAPGCVYIQVGETYETIHETNTSYTLKHKADITYNKLWFKPVEYVHKTDPITERIEQLEAKVRQLQDQLDHHDHKTPIDFTVEIEHK